MGKKQVAVSLRKPPPPADFDRFVNRAEPSRPNNDAEPAGPPARAAAAPVVATRIGERREVTIYLPQELARALSVRCVELDRDMSNVIAEAVRRSLDASSDEPVAVAVPADRWERARALIAEIRTRIPSRLRFGLI
jgi:hypothetical protein